MTPKLLIIPGLGDSGVGHWQNFWLDHFPNSAKVTQDNWDQPLLRDWLKRLEATLKTIQEPTILVAHSLATILVAHWTKTFENPFIKGALLVAPADVDSPEHTPECIWNFAPIPLHSLPFPSIVIGSENDPYMSLERAQELAKNWGSDFINIGKKGHINSEMNLGLWIEGQDILKLLIQKIN
nr:alpha/beta hydrolase [uncultured Flavobacterium sp.]